MYIVNFNNGINAISCFTLNRRADWYLYTMAQIIFIKGIIKMHHIYKSQIVYKLHPKLRGATQNHLRRLLIYVYIITQSFYLSQMLSRSTVHLYYRQSININAANIYVYIHTNKQFAALCGHFRRNADILTIITGRLGSSLQRHHLPRAWKRRKINRKQDAEAWIFAEADARWYRRQQASAHDFTRTRIHIYTHIHTKIRTQISAR